MNMWVCGGGGVFIFENAYSSKGTTTIVYGFTRCDGDLGGITGATIVVW